MAKQVTSGPNSRKYVDNSGQAGGWLFLVAGVFFGALLMFRPPDQFGVTPGPTASIVTFLIACGLSALSFGFRAETVVDKAEGIVTRYAGFRRLKPSATYQLSEFVCIALGGRVGTRIGPTGYTLVLDRGPTAVSNLQLITFDRQTDAKSEADALSSLTGLPVRDPAHDPQAYRGIGPPPNVGA